MNKKKRSNTTFDIEKDYGIIIKSDNINIDLANRILMHLIEDNNKKKVERLFNKIKNYQNETTFSLMIRYYSKVDIEKAINLLMIMQKNNIKIKKRTVVPIFNQLCKEKMLKRAIYFFRNFIKNNYLLNTSDYNCILELLFNNFELKYMKTIFKSMRKNLAKINNDIESIFIKGLSKNNINYQMCSIINGKCNNVQLKSINLDITEKKTILKNIEKTYIKSNEKELKLYRSFLETSNDKNIILDGANILFYIDRKVTLDSYKRLNSIYQKIQELEYNPIIILHKRHKDYISSLGLSNTDQRIITDYYKKWEKDKNLYLTPYKMNDDWFFIYGSIFKNNMVVTNDHLRDHIFKISEKNIFNDILKKWIERNIIRYNFNYGDYDNLKTLKLIFPLDYSIKIQKIKKNWYFPIENKDKWLVIYTLKSG